MDYSWAKPGVKVECIDSTSGGGNWTGDEVPVVGRTYTIRKVWIYKKRGYLVCDFLDLRRSYVSKELMGSDIGYNINRFRPLITKDQDADLFKSLLNPTQQDHDKLLDHELIQLTAAYARDAAKGSAGI